MRDQKKLQEIYLQLYEELGVTKHITNPEMSAWAMADVDLEYTSCYGEPEVKKNFDITFPAPKGVGKNQIIEIKNVQFFSRCEHHSSPMWGLAHYFYIPNEKVTGLSKVARIVDWYGKRWQMQEQYTEQVSQYLWSVVKPVAQVTILEGVHMCVGMRGARSTRTVTSTRVQKVDNKLYKKQKGEGELYHLIKDLLNHQATGRTGEVSFL